MSRARTAALRLADPGEYLQGYCRRVRVYADGVQRPCPNPAVADLCDHHDRDAQAARADHREVTWEAAWGPVLCEGCEGRFLAGERVAQSRGHNWCLECFAERSA